MTFSIRRRISRSTVIERRRLDRPREKKEAKNFACKFDKAIFEKLEDFCKLSGMNKTNVVERAVEKYIEENMELVKEVAKKL